MDRRTWLRNAALIVAGAVAEDQLELLSRLGWTRTLFPSADVRQRGVLMGSMDGTNWVHLAAAFPDENGRLVFQLPTPTRFMHVLGIPRSAYSRVQITTPLVDLIRDNPPQVARLTHSGPRRR